MTDEEKFLNDHPDIIERITAVRDGSIPTEKVSINEGLIRRWQELRDMPDSPEDDLYTPTEAALQAVWRLIHLADFTGWGLFPSVDHAGGFCIERVADGDFQQILVDGEGTLFTYLLRDRDDQGTEAEVTEDEAVTFVG